MPGGARLRKTSSRPCKYGARDSDGKCPKAPKKPRAAKKPRAKAACKYGPRDSEGRCPKKPAQVRKLKSIDAAAQQAGEVIRSKKATKAQKKEAVKVLGSAVAGEVGRKVTSDIVRAAKKHARSSGTQKQVIAAAKKALPLAAGIGKAGVVGAAIGGTLVVGGRVLDANRDREAKKWADQQLAATKKKVKLTAEQERVLHGQYVSHAKKKAVTNPFTGK